MAIGVKCDSDATVAEPFTHNLGMNTLPQHKRGMGVDSRGGLRRCRKLFPLKMVYGKEREHITAETGATVCQGIYEEALPECVKSIVSGTGTFQGASLRLDMLPAEEKPAGE